MKAGDNWKLSFILTGAATGTPTAILLRGLALSSSGGMVADSTVGSSGTITATAGVKINQWNLAVTIPAMYLPGDTVEMVATATVGSLTQDFVIGRVYIGPSEPGTGICSAASGTGITLDTKDPFHGSTALVDSRVLIMGGTKAGTVGVITASDGSGAVMVASWSHGTPSVGDPYMILVSAAAGGGYDPWAANLPGSYASGTAGYILGHNIDAQVSTRSVYAGGPVASVTSPVLLPATAPNGYGGGGSSGPTAVQIRQEIDSNSTQLAAIKVISDQLGSMLQSDGASGFQFTVLALANAPFGSGGGGGSGNVAVDNLGRVKLAPNGLDFVIVESGINVRQALSPILAASAGIVTGAGTGNIAIKAANAPGVTRITAQCDNLGNRNTVTLTLPS